MLFTASHLDPKEGQVLDQINTMRASVAYQVREPRRWPGLLRQQLFARAIRASNQIEGYNVSATDALAAVEGGEPIEAPRRDWKAVIGYRNAMTYVLQLASDEQFRYDETLLRSLHFMMLNHNLEKHPGRWRPGAVNVRDGDTGEVVYEAPEAEQVPDLMHELVNDLDSDNETPLIVRAGLAHLNLVMVHPFADGNGRMARGLETLVLARGGILSPEFCSIEEWLGRNTREYYSVLATVGKGAWNPSPDTKTWIRFIIKAHYQQTIKVLRRIKEARRLYDELENRVSQLKLPERSIGPLFNAASGHVITNSFYRADDYEVSEWQAGRDLKRLVEADLLRPHGSKRGRVYLWSPELQAIREKTKEQRVGLEDPFAAPTNAVLAKAEIEGAPV